LSLVNNMSIIIHLNKRQRIPKGQSNMDNQRNWQDRVCKTKENKAKQTTQYVLDTTIELQTQIT
jgi:hypothetical protein